jgi:hypothetical protein
MPVENISQDEHTALLYKATQLPCDKGKQIEEDLQMYLHKYNELLADLQETIKNYKATARKIKGGDKDEEP